ncbi:MAG: PAS domain-containing sensor histidine kinase [Deltaproteobacteria bacterium]|nr:PAS domain-containing sensor histidine kinase [Deltaproteobacteria bacterium]
MFPPDDAIISAIADSLPLGIWVARVPNGELVFANDTFREIMGMDAISDVGVGEYAAPYAIHRTDGELYPETEMPFVTAMQSGEMTIADDIVIHRRDGRKVNIRAYARPMFEGEDGAMSHVVVAFLDVSREMEAQRAESDAKERIERMQRMETVGNLAGGIAHDFNNLLSAIHTISARLHSTEQDPDRARHLKTIQDIVGSATALSRQLLDFASSGGGESKPVKLTPIVLRVIANLTPSLGGLAVSTALDGPLVVHGDDARFDQLVMNLVLNARDAGATTLSIEGRSVGDRVELVFADDGPGVPEEIRDSIFEPYFSTKEGQIEGRSGLGLATVYNVVMRYSGEITIEDSSAGGALFRVSLPT